MQCACAWYFCVLTEWSADEKTNVYFVYFYMYENSIMCWIYAEEIKLVFNTTEFLIMMAFDLYACSIFAHFRFGFTFFFSFFFSTWLCSLLFSAVCVYSATLSLVERRALLTCDTISKYRNVSKQWCWWVWSSHSLCVFLAKLLLTARTWEGDAWLSRTELMECVRTDVALRVCAWLWVSAFVCAFMCVGIENVKQPVQNGATSSAFAGWPIQQIK